MANIINGTDTGIGGLITTGDVSDELQLQTAETARVTLTNTAVVVNEDGNDVDFRVEGDTDANLLFVDAGNDWVGIGTSSPGAKLDVNGNVFVGTTTAFASDTDKPKFGVASSDASFDSLSTDADEGCFENNGNAGVTIVSAASSTGNIYFGRPSFPAIGRIVYNHTDEALIFGTNNNAERMRIDSSGNVGIGTSSPSSKFHVAGGTDPTITLQNTTGGESTLTLVAGGNSSIRTTAGLTFVTDGSERMRIDSSGSLRINNTGSGGTGPNGVGKFAMTSNGYTMSMGGQFIAGDNGSTYFTIGNFGDSSSEMRVSTRGYTTFYTGATSESNGSERMRIDSSGRLLVGTTAKGTYGGNTVEFRGANLSSLGSNDTGNLAIFTTDSQAADVGAVISLGGVYASSTPYAFGAIAARKENSTIGNAQGYLQFYTTNAGNGITEAARIDSSGRLLVGATSTTKSGHHFVRDTNELNLCAAGIGGTLLYFNYESDTTMTEIGFWNGAASYVALKALSFTPTSDYRIKSNITPVGSVLDKVNALNPVSYNKAPTDVCEIGLIAHELQEHFPDLVTGIKDEIDEDGDDVLQGVNYMGLTAVLVKAVQELKAELDTVKAELATLKG